MRSSKLEIQNDVSVQSLFGDGPTPGDPQPGVQQLVNGFGP